METKICKHCNQKLDLEGRVFSNHVRWCDNNPARNKTENISKGSQRFLDNKFGSITDFEVICSSPNCEKTIVIKEREYQFPKKEKYFCNRSCSNCRVRTEKVKNKIRQSLSGRQIAPRRECICENCNVSFEILATCSRIFCSNKCRIEFNKPDDEYLQYKHACKFNFNIWDFPHHFDTDLIRKHGWYKASNRGNNLNGVSRDHKISIKYGWENNILPEIMSHPANCKLMRHRDNFAKKAKCSISLEDLKKDIYNWDNDLSS